MSNFKVKMGFLAAAVLGISALVATPAARADIIFSGTGTSGSLDGATETWKINADGGAAATGYLDNWGSPGVGKGTVAYSAPDSAYGMIVTFSGGGHINAKSIATGNGANCAGSTAGGTTFCMIGSPDDIWEAFLTGTDTIEFRAQSATFFLQQNQKYFVNVFFDGAAPTSFSGRWLTRFSPNPVPEPASIAMFGAGLLGLGLMLTLRRRKQYSTAEPPRATPVRRRIP